MAGFSQAVPGRLGWLVTWSLVVLALAGVAAVSAADSDDDYKRGLEAIDLADWTTAVRHLRAAVAADAQASTRRVFLSGVFSRPYLPHFYLGWALAQSGDAGCPEALSAWETAEAQGVVLQIQRQHQDLQSGRARCVEVMLPNALRDAERALDVATRSLEELPSAADEAGRASRRELAGRLASVSERFEQANDLDEPVAVLRAVERVDGDAIALFGAIDTERRRLAQAASTRAQGELATARDAARQSLIDAETAERAVLDLLADPRHADARRRHPELVVPADVRNRLVVARRTLSTATDVASLRAIGRDGDAVAERLRALYTRAETVLADDASEAAAAPPPSPPTSPVSTPASATPQPAPAVDTVLRSLRDRALGLLGATADLGEVSRLLTLQRQRLTALVAEADRIPTSRDGAGAVLQDRMRASFSALRLVAAGHVFLQGDGARTERLLTNLPERGGVLVAQAYLLRAAARWQRMRRTPEPDESVRSAAAADAVRSRTLDPGLTLDPLFFSPTFRDWYQAAVGETATPSPSPG